MIHLLPIFAAGGDPTKVGDLGDLGGLCFAPGVWTVPSDRDRPPPVEAVVETAVYAADLAAVEAFYGGVLGLPVIGREAGRHVFFRVGTWDVLLVFNPAATSAVSGMLPPHG